MAAGGPIPPSEYKRLERQEHPRIARFLTFSCFHNQAFLTSDRACGWFMNALTTTRQKHDIRLWAYCLMPTHVHILLVPWSETVNVPDVLRTLKQSVSRVAVAYIKQNAPSFLRRMTGPAGDGRIAYRFWQRGGGYDRTLWSGDAIWEAIEYIHMNPVNDRLCKRPQDWKWSSAAFFHNKQPIPVPVDLETIPWRT